MWLDFLIPKADQTLFIPSKTLCWFHTYNLVTRIVLPGNPLILFFLFFFYFIFFSFSLTLFFSFLSFLLSFVTLSSWRNGGGWLPFIVKQDVWDGDKYHTHLLPFLATFPKQWLSHVLPLQTGHVININLSKRHCLFPFFLDKPRISLLFSSLTRWWWQSQAVYDSLLLPLRHVKCLKTIRNI